MEIIYSKIQPRLICHIVIRADDFDSERKDVIEPYHLLQLAIMKLPKGKTFNAHRHIPKKQITNVASQESWVCLKGSVKCILYDIAGTDVIAEPILKAGDISISLCGGHNYEILRKDTRIAEFKTGKYEGVEKDKVFI